MSIGLEIGIYAIAAFLLSFVLCSLIYRLPREMNVIKLEAKCPKCEEKTSWWRFIPIFGYIFGKGKYKCCNEKMSISRLLAPIVFIGLAVLGVWIVGTKFGCFKDALIDLEYDGDKINLYLELYRGILFAFAFALVIVIFTDFETYIIPDTCHVIIIIAAILAMVFKMTSVLWGIFGGIIFFMAFFIIGRIAYRKTGNPDVMGFGDVKLMGACGLFLGAGKCLLGVIFGSFLALLIEGIFILIKRKKRGQGVAFGPYLAIGMLIAAYFGNTIIQAYEKMLGIA